MSIARGGYRACGCHIEWPDNGPMRLVFCGDHSQLEHWREVLKAFRAAAQIAADGGPALDPARVIATVDSIFPR